MRPTVFLLACVLASSAALPLGGRAATQTGAAPKGQPTKISAEDLAKECSADATKAEAKYGGKALRVTGVVGDVHDDILYLPVQVKGAGEVLVGIRYGKGNKPAVKKGDTATFDGKFDRIAVLGPALVECKLVADGDKK